MNTTHKQLVAMIPLFFVLLTACSVQSQFATSGMQGGNVSYGNRGADNPEAMPDDEEIPVDGIEVINMDGDTIELEITNPSGDANAAVSDDQEDGGDVDSAALEGAPDPLPIPVTIAKADEECDSSEEGEAQTIVYKTAGYEDTVEGEILVCRHDLEADEYYWGRIENTEGDLLVSATTTNRKTGEVDEFEVALTKEGTFKISK
ncbi:MAG: hypothetical protein HQM16_08675 [Deltaproteobacteria bacterium]|nr:hypothetical protein [Deltaproteobacteria bacterium]